MDINDLKSGWQQAGGVHKTTTDLQNMTKVKNHPSVKKIRRKLVIETIFLTFFLVIYYDWFDGDKKPVVTNTLLVISVILVILKDVIGFLSITIPANGIDLKSNIQNYLLRIKRLSVVSLSLSVLYSISLILFFSATITFTTQKYLMEAGLVITLLCSIYFSYRIWSTRIRNLADLSLLMEDDDLPELDLR